MAYWWMHPPPSDQGERVLVYRPVARPTTGPAPATTSLPEIYASAAPMLRCTGGQVFHSQINRSLGLHLAFFEWDGTDTGSVLEAFRHMPEACMGAIGMKLISKEQPIFYEVGPPSLNQALTTPPVIRNPSKKNQSAKINQPSSTLVFDHTIFREAGQGGGLLTPGAIVHSFRCVWVSGISLSDARSGLGGDEFNRLRTIRLKSAFTRFRPKHARVIQGAVRGASTGEDAWAAFQKAILVDLAFEASWP